jgi:N-acetylneuraminic acid mutarotase
MYIGRQYFTTCLDMADKSNPDNLDKKNKSFLYAISGFNHEYQVMNDTERFNMETNSWEQIEPVNIARLNASACKCGSKYIYLFGGLDVEKNEMTDSIERYNTELHIWTTLSQIKLPAKISNCFAFCFDPKFIIIMGGITKKETAN